MLDFLFKLFSKKNSLEHIQEKMNLLVRKNKIKKLEGLLPHAKISEWSKESMINFGDTVRWIWGINGDKFTADQKTKQQNFINNLVKHIPAEHHEELFLLALDYEEQFFLEAFHPLVGFIEDNRKLLCVAGGSWDRERKHNFLLKYAGDKFLPDDLMAVSLFYNMEGVFADTKQKPIDKNRVLATISKWGGIPESTNPKCYNDFLKWTCDTEKENLLSALPAMAGREERRIARKM